MGGAFLAGYGQMAGLGDPGRVGRGTKGREGGDYRGVAPSVDGRGGRGWGWGGALRQNPDARSDENLPERKQL